MSILTNRSLHQFLKVSYFAFIFFQIALGRAFSGLGIGYYRVTTILHILGFCYFIYIFIKKINDSNFLQRKVIIVQTSCFLYLIFYYFLNFNEINNITNLIETLRHTTIYFIGVWYIIGVYISKHINPKIYLSIILTASLFQYFSFTLNQNLLTVFLNNYSDKGFQIYNASDLGVYFFIVSLIILFIPDYSPIINLTLALYFFFLPAILSASRGSFLAYVIAGLYFYFLTRKRFKVNKLVVFLIICSIFISFILIPSTSEDKYSDNNLTSILLNPFLKQDRNNFINLENPDSNIEYRLDVWNNMLKHTLSNNSQVFLFGEYYTKTHPAQIEVNILYNSADPLVPEYPHNFIIFLQSKYGLFGLVMFLYLLISIYKNIDFSKRRVLATLPLFLLIDGLFDYVLCDPYTSFLIFINLGIICKKFKPANGSY